MLELAIREGFIINDHNSGTEKMPLSKWGVVKLTHLDTGEEDLCPISMDSIVTCMNPLYVGKDNHVHLSTWSIGGNVWYLDIERYNKEFSPKEKYSLNQKLDWAYKPC